jgi:hypothetical protein
LRIRFDAMISPWIWIGASPKRRVGGEEPAELGKDDGGGGGLWPRLVRGEPNMQGGPGVIRESRLKIWGLAFSGTPSEAATATLICSASPLAARPRTTPPAARAAVP